jgi:ABC-type long-subunit fatty acid transport system fused permease/ATPase subunit
MGRIALVVIGVLVALAGIVFTLQGLGYVSGSFMTGATVWAVIGPVIALAGLGMVALAFRGRRRAP